MNKKEILAIAIAFVIRGIYTQESAKMEYESIAKELKVNQKDKSLKVQLAVMQACIELFDAREAAKSDWKA